MACPGPAAAGTGAGARTGAAAGAGAVSPAAEAAPSEAASPAAAAEAAAAGWFRFFPGTVGAGPGPSVRPCRIPQAADEHIVGAEAAPISVGGRRHPDDKEHHHQQDHQPHQTQAAVVLVIRVISRVVVLGQVVPAALLGQLGGPAVVPDGKVQLLAVVQVRQDRRMVPAGISQGVHAVHPRRIVPGQGHLPHPGLVEPAGGIDILHGAVGPQGVHILLDPAVGEPEGLPVVIVPVEVHIHIAVVEAQAVDVVRQGLLLADAAVGHADLHPADRPLRQHRPL